MLLFYPELKVRRNFVIGVGVVVTKDIPDNTVAAGIPASVIEDIYEYAKKEINACLQNICLMMKKELFLQKER